MYILINPLPAELLFIFPPTLSYIARNRDLQLELGENYSYLHWQRRMYPRVTNHANSNLYMRCLY